MSQDNINLFDVLRYCFPAVRFHSSYPMARLGSRFSYLPQMNPRAPARGCIALWLLCALLSPSAFAQNSAVASVSGGRVRGLAREAGAVFVGIPFAPPPIGPLRWRPPQPVEPWAGIRDATEPSRDAIQPDDGAWNRPMIANSSEDCLYLNVVTPEWPASGKLPVIVFVHGGGNFAGGAWEHLAKGITLQNAGVVVVTVNY